MDAIWQFWDRVELWLVTLPFALQLTLVLLGGTPLFVLAARVTDAVADRLVGTVRGLVGVRPAPTTQPAPREGH